MKKYLDEVTKITLKNGKKLTPKQEKYFSEQKYPSQFKYYNIRKPQLNKILKNGFSFSTLEEKKQAQIWNYIYKNTKFLDVGHLAIDFFKSLQRKPNSEITKYWPLLKTWITRIDTWEHGDMIASLYSAILELNPSLVYPTLKTWSQSKNPWKRRMSIISLLYYFRCRKKIPRYQEIEDLLIPQLKINHYYVQKAVGWTIRELSQAYPKKTETFFRKYVTSISSIGFSAAIEKLPKSKKEEYKRIRKAHKLPHNIGSKLKHL